MTLTPKQLPLGLGPPRHHAQAAGAVDALKKVPRAPGRDPRDKGIDRDRIEVWFGDEARIGQKNKITRRWARRGTRPSAPHDQRTASTYIFGYLPRRWQGSGARPARLQHRGDEPAPRRNRRRSGSRQPRRTRRRPGRMAPLGRPRASRQHHARGAPAQMPGAQPRRE